MQAVKPVMDRLGGRIQDAWLSFGGDYDVLAILEVPDHVSAAALYQAVAAGGAVRAIKITPLVTWEEGMEAGRRARQLPYRPPSAS